jgi:hypothetical protein
MIGAEENVDSKQVAPNAGNAVPVWRQIDAGSFRILPAKLSHCVCTTGSTKIKYRARRTGDRLESNKAIKQQARSLSLYGRGVWNANCLSI